MMRNDLIRSNPLRGLEHEGSALLSPGGLGVVLSPAGVGKTAFVVQIAIDAMLRGEKVLHISLNDSIDKITLWYRELFLNIVGHHNLERPDDTWQSILPLRFIMTFKIARFSTPILEERLADLMEQDIFKPSLLAIDALAFADNDIPGIAELKSLVERRNMSLWITGNSHRDDERGPDGIPARLSPVIDHVDRILELIPGEESINVRSLKGLPDKSTDTGLYLDPATMLIHVRDRD
ncbi:MAG: AAA family ATPase [Syntrophales bacterium]|jgi:hypothetical protein|nr:AAA family ATPase [Syntrophales bacterium]MCK9528274.1 AAA family ATPase [Syntrophales bacterium]MDX9922406.1 hypothetical protein [Syntrophales bacterium]